MAIQRQTAYRLNIGDLNTGEFVKGTGEWEASYLKIQNKQVSRINIIGTIVDMFKSEDNSYFTAMIDDGTGNMRIRGWKEEIDLFNDLAIGDLVLLVGKIKDYTGSVYITPEIVRKLNNKKWLELRQLEIRQNGTITISMDDPKNSVITKLKELDNSNGIEISELANQLGLKEEELEKEVEDLIKEGEVYQVRPGFLKLI